MKKFVALFAIVVIIVILWLAFGINKNKATAPTTTESSQTASSAVQTDKVVIKDFAFNPNDINVKKGTTVTWTNQDSTAHQPAENDGQNGPSSPPLDQGQSYSFKFERDGTFHYHCSIHPEMTGTVNVTD